MTDARRAFGQAGEDRAAAWYRAHGYAVLDRNWRCREGELDLVVRRGRTLVFVEVKARRTDRFGIARRGRHPDQAATAARPRRRYLEATERAAGWPPLRRREHPRGPPRGDRGGVLSRQPKNAQATNATHTRIATATIR